MDIKIQKYILTRNIRKLVLAGESVRNFKNKIYKDETAISKSMYIDK